MTSSDPKRDVRDCWSISPKNTPIETLRERFSDTDKALIAHLNECEACRRLCYAVLNQTPDGVTLTEADEKFFSPEERMRRTLGIFARLEERKKILEGVDDLLA